MKIVDAKCLAFLLGACLLQSPVQAQTESSAERTLALSSFGTIGALYNNVEQADYVRNALQPEGAGRSRSLDYGVDSLLGLQLDLAPGKNLSGMLQVVSHRRADNTFKPELTWAFAKYYLGDKAVFRLGRVGVDFYMLAESRNVGYAFTWARPPVDFFGPLTVSYFDGGDLVFNQPLGDGHARVKLYGGRLSEKMPSTSVTGAFDWSGAPLLGAHVEYQSEKWHFRLGYAQVTYRGEPSGIAEALSILRQPLAQTLTDSGGGVLADDLSMDGKKARYLSAGIVHDDGPWQAQLMASRILEGSIYPDVKSGYFTLAYRKDLWTPYATLSVVSSGDVRAGSGLPAVGPLAPVATAVDQLLPALAATQATLSLGVRYDFMRNAALKLQLDRVRVRKNALWMNQQPRDWAGRATLFSAVVDFVF